MQEQRDNKAALRKHYRELRRALPTDLQTLYAEQAATILSQQAEFESAQQLGLYCSLPEEISTAHFFDVAYNAEKICAVPVLGEGNRLEFVKINPQTQWKTNRYGILEPIDVETHIAPESLDLVLVPLVSFDLQGHRLGMGAGFYDHTFSFRREQPKPALFGLAYECQLHASLPVNAWDIGLDAVITEKNCYRFI